MAEPVVQVVPKATYTVNRGTGGVAAAVTAATTKQDTGTLYAGTPIPNDRHTGGKLHVSARLTGTGSPPGVALSMTLALYGLNATDDLWYHLADLGGGAAISYATQPRSFLDNTAQNDCRWGEVVDVDGGYAAYDVQVIAIAGSGASVTTRIGFVRG